MNCWPALLPTRCAPFGSNGGPPFAGVVEATEVLSVIAALEVVSTGTMATEALALVLADGKPHPSLPF